LALLVGLAPAARADFPVTGTFQYQNRELSFASGFTGSKPSLPIRHARVQVLDANTSAVLATGATDASGSVSLFVPGAGTNDVLVRCFSRSDALGAKTQRVTNNAKSDYSVSSSRFVSQSQALDLDVGTVLALELSSGGLLGNPFNMLDQMVSGVEYVKASGGANPPRSLHLMWPGGVGSFASGTVATIAYDYDYDLV